MVFFIGLVTHKLWTIIDLEKPPETLVVKIIVHDKNLFLVAQTFLSVWFEAVFKNNTDKNVCATEASIQAVCEILSCTKVIPNSFSLNAAWDQVASG